MTLGVGIPKKPYLVKALFDWIVDNGLTPHVVVDTRIEGVVVPTSFIKDDQITLNLGVEATRSFFMDRELIEFSARFSGTPFNVSVPVHAVKAILARETGEGMVFSDESLQDERAAGPLPKAPEKKRPQLRIVK